MVGAWPLGRALWALCASFHAADAARQSEGARRVPGRLVTPGSAAPAAAGRAAGSGAAPTAPPVIVVVAPRREPPPPGPGAGAAPAGLAALEGRVERLEGAVPGLGEALERQARQLAGLAEGARAPGPAAPAAPAGAGAEAALAEHEAVLAAIKADMDGRLAALQSQLTSFETRMQGNLVAAKQELDTKFNTLEARVAVNEGKLKGVEENSLGNILGGGL